MQSRASGSPHAQNKAAAGGRQLIHSLVSHMYPSSKQPKDRMEGVLIVNGLSERMRRIPHMPKLIPGSRCADSVEAMSPEKCLKPMRSQSSPSCDKARTGKPMRKRPASAFQPKTAKINPLLRCNSVVLLYINDLCHMPSGSLFMWDFCRRALSSLTYRFPAINAAQLFTGKTTHMLVLDSSGLMRGKQLVRYWYSANTN